MYTNNLFSLITILKYKILKIKCYSSNFTFFYSRRECTRSTTNSRARKTNKGHRYTRKPKTNTVKTMPNNLPCYQQTTAEPCCYQNRKLMLSYTAVTAAPKQSRTRRIPQLQPRKHSRPPKPYRNKHSIGFHCHS